MLAVGANLDFIGYDVQAPNRFHPCEIGSAGLALVDRAAESASKRSFGIQSMEAGKMSDQVPVQAVVAAFKTPDGASNALEELKGVSSDVLSVKEAAVLVRDGDGKLQIKESHHLAKGAVVGGVAGAVVGLIAGPVGWAALGGAAIGGLANRLRDTGFPDDRLKQVGEALTPGTSALVAIVEHRWVAPVEERLRAMEADIVTEAVQADVAAQLEEQAAAGS
jgi:uncharacterized membrane protein